MCLSLLLSLLENAKQITIERLAKKSELFSNLRLMIGIDRKVTRESDPLHKNMFSYREGIFAVTQTAVGSTGSAATTTR